MDPFSIDIQPKKALHVHQLGEGITPGLKKALTKVGRLVLREAITNVSGRILQARSGRLRSALGMEIAAQGAGWILGVGGSLADVPYLRIHDLGGQAGRGHKTHIPKRAYLTRSFTAKKQEIREELQAFMAQLMRRHG